MAAPTGTDSQTNDDALTVCAISLLSAMKANVLHEGLGHGALALMTGAQSGVLTTVAWSSAFDSRLVALGGTLGTFRWGPAEYQSFLGWNREFPNKKAPKPRRSKSRYGSNTRHSFADE